MNQGTCYQMLGTQFVAYDSLYTESGLGFGRCDRTRSA